MNEKELLNFKYEEEANKLAKNLHKKVAIFWGGADVSPVLYKRDVSNKCGGTDIDNDLSQAEIMMNNIDNGIPIIGICRGAQLLNVVNGGILVQHIEGHTNPHTVSIRCDIKGYKKDITCDKVSSTHHQMMIPHESGIILGTDTKRINKGVHWDNVNDPHLYNTGIEVVYYPETNCLCIQPHPEWMSEDNDFTIFLHEFMEKVMKVVPFSFRVAENISLNEDHTFDFGPYVSRKDIINFRDLLAIRKEQQDLIIQKEKEDMAKRIKITQETLLDKETIDKYFATYAFGYDNNYDLALQKKIANIVNKNVKR